MPRDYGWATNVAKIAVVLLLGGALVGNVRAEPLNPLRPALNGAPALRVVPSGEIALIGQAAVAAGDQSSELKSVVPPQFGQPELLPAPGATPDVQQPFGEHRFEEGPNFDEYVPWERTVHPLFAEPWFPHGDPNDPKRHIGIGQPLIGTSWRNRPLYFGTFVGGIMMDDLVSNQIYQNDTTFVGARLGFDFDHFWGLEARWAFARTDLADSNGTPFFPASRDNFADLSLVYYPLGDARWRPYLVAGLGFQTYRFNDEAGERISEALFEIPLGCGIKYFYSPWFTLRFDFVDNLAVGNERINGMHNIALMMGAEVRFGGRRPSYFPWHGNTTYW